MQPQIKYQFRVQIKNQPGSFHDVAQALQKAGVQMEGSCNTTQDSSSQDARLYFVCDQPDKAETALSSLGLQYTKEQVLSLHFRDRPSALSDVTDAFGAAKINITDFYWWTDPIQSKDTTMYVGVKSSDFQQATQIAQSI